MVSCAAAQLIFVLVFVSENAFVCSPLAWLASTWHQLHGLSPWKFSYTARFCFLFLFSTTLFGTNLIDDMTSTWCGCRGINFDSLWPLCFATVSFYGLLSLPSLMLISVTIHIAYTTITHVANYERAGLWSTEFPSLMFFLAAELAINNSTSRKLGVGADDAFALLIKRELFYGNTNLPASDRNVWAEM